MVFGEVHSDPGPAFWTVFFAQLPTLIAAIGAAIVSIIAAIKSQQNGIKADKAIAQNELIIRQGNGLIDKATQSGHEIGYAMGLQDAAAAQVPTVAAAVAVGVAAAKKAEDVKATK